MKTIKLSDEDYKFLVEAKNELLTQDNRSTRDVIYCIQDHKKLPTSEDYASDYVWVDTRGDHQEICSSADGDEYLKLVEYIFESDDPSNLLGYYGQEQDLIIDKDNVSDDNKKDIATWLNEDLTFIDDIDDIGYDYIKRIYLHEESFIVMDAPHSLFEKDAVEHLESNHYHYTKDARTYGCCNWRAPRMETLRKLLMSINLEDVNEVL